MSDALPQGWSDVRLGAIGSFVRGRGGTKSDEWPNGLPCIRYGELYTRHDCIVRDFYSFISPASTSAYTPLRSGDVIFAASGETLDEIGKAAAYCGTDAAYAGADTVIFRPADPLDPRFVGYAVNSLAANQHKSRMGQGSSVMHISAEQLGRLPLRLPPLHQQQRIAEILTTIDEAIEQTQGLIEKTQQIKTGLMHDLFTRGVMPNGQLRPTREEAPQLYKESPLGWVPREWTPDAFGSRVNIIDPNPSHRYPEAQETGVPICSTENFCGEDAFDLSTSKFVLADVLVAQRERCHFAADDVIFARKGRIGLARRYGTEPKVFSHTVVILKARAPKADQQWLLWVSRSHWLLNGIDKRMNSNSGVPTLGVELIDSVAVPFPEIDEQQRINSRLNEISQRLAVEADHLAKLRQLKSGMMQDLLTGRVRVQVTNVQAVSAHV